MVRLMIDQNWKKNYLEIAKAVPSCMELAAQDSEIQELCLQSVFNSDYFWE